MENFEQKKQELVNAFEQVLNDWKDVQMAIFLSKTDDLDGSKALEDYESLVQQFKLLKKEDYSSEAEFSKARKELFRSLSRNPNFEKRNQIQEKMGDLLTQMDDLVTAHKNILKIEKLIKDNE